MRLQWRVSQTCCLTSTCHSPDHTELTALCPSSWSAFSFLQTWPFAASPCPENNKRQAVVTGWIKWINEQFNCLIWQLSDTPDNGYRYLINWSELGRFFRLTFHLKKYDKTTQHYQWTHSLWCCNVFQFHSCILLRSCKKAKPNSMFSPLHDIHRGRFSWKLEFHYQMCTVSYSNPYSVKIKCTPVQSVYMQVQG